MDSFKTFVIMFVKMRDVCDETLSEDLRNYLSDLNPFWFSDKGSADPAEYIEFDEAFQAFFGDTTPSTAELYDFCKAYVSKTAPAEAVDAFLRTEKKDWIEFFDSVEEE